MASVIRLLPKKKVERNVVPYTVLLDNVMRKRFNQAALTTAYLDLAAAAASAVVLPKGTVSVGKILSLLLATLTVLVMEKIVVRTESPAYASAAAEIRGKATSILTYVVLLAHLISGWLYLHSFFLPHTRFFEVRHAQPSKLPAGIPESLALHRTTSWYVVNEQHLYVASFVLVLAIVSGVRYVLSSANILRLDPNEDGVKPLIRIKRRIKSRTVLAALLGWAAVFVVHPLLFFTLRNRALLPVLKLWIARRATDTIELSGFRVANFALPVLLLPLVLLWALSHEILMAYLTLGPVYRGKPISDSASADKNGTLAEGLGRNPSNLSALTAWHELLVIAEHDQPRRKSIFNDVDGDRIIWDQIYKSFDKLLQKHITALQPKKNAESKVSKAANTNTNATKPTKPQAGSWHGVTSTAAILAGHPSSDSIDHRGDNTHIYINSAPPSQIYKPESAFEKKLASFTKTLQNNSTTRAQKTRAKLLALARKLYSYAGSVHRKFLATRAGSLFRKTVARGLAAKIRHPQTTSFALRGIARIITKSVAEDEYGFVQNSIAPALASLDALAALLEKTAAEPSIDESDVLVKQGVQQPNVELATKLAGEVNGAFAEIIEVFAPYLESLGVSPAVQLRAKRIASNDVPIEKTAWLSSSL